ncbi:HTH_48 domain-containing protein [Trichonephila clavipes]|nr:HTH_48 domain-containing protein [Trichonephila clavipes]
MEVTRVEQRAYIKIAVLRRRNAMECHCELVEALRSNAIPYSTVARWVGKFSKDVCQLVMSNARDDRSPTVLSCVSPCDFDLIPKIKEPIRGRRFATQGYCYCCVPTGDPIHTWCDKR